MKIIFFNEYLDMGCFCYIPAGFGSYRIPAECWPQEDSDQEGGSQWPSIQGQWNLFFKIWMPRTRVFFSETFDAFSPYVWKKDDVINWILSLRMLFDNCVYGNILHEHLKV